MTELEKKLRIADIYDQIGVDETLKRLERDAGSGALTGFADAKRTETGQCGGDPQSLAVSPGKAKAAESELTKWEALAARHLEIAEQPWLVNEAVIRPHFHRCLAAVYTTCACAARLWLPEPDSKLVHGSASSE